MNASMKKPIVLLYDTFRETYMITTWILEDFFAIIRD